MATGSENVKQAREIADRTNILVKGVALVVAIIFVGLVALQYQVTRNNDHLDRVERSVAGLEAFVNDVRESRESETSRAQEEAIAKAVAEVPRIKAILCEAFPETSPCRE